MSPFVAEHRATFADTDAAGIVHFSTVFFWVEATEEALFRELGVPFLRAEGSRVSGFPRVRVECDYLSPVMRGELVTVALRPSELGEKRIVWAFDIKAAGRDVARGSLVAVHAWREGQGAIAASLVPEDVRRAIAGRFGL